MTPEQQTSLNDALDAVKIIPLLPDGAKALYLNRFHALTNAFQGSPEYS